MTTFLQRPKIFLLTGKDTLYSLSLTEGVGPKCAISGSMPPFYSAQRWACQPRAEWTAVGIESTAATFLFATHSYLVHGDDN